MITLLGICLSLFVQFGVPPQQSPASVEGVVVKLGTGEPLAGANVQLDPESRQLTRRTAKSDSSGRFVFEDVAPGAYRMIATYDGGFVPVEYGQRSATGQGTSFLLAPGQTMTGIQLAMPPTGSISGRIYGRNGEPLGNAQVMALRQAYKDGQRTLTIVQIVATDDRGEYRLFWLTPGRYYVSAKPGISEFTANIGQANSYSAPAVHITPPARFGTFEEATVPAVRSRRLKTGEIVEEMYLPVYYPGAVDAHSAAPLDVPAGASVGGVDIMTEAGLIRAHHIRGRIIDQRNGQPVANASLSAVPATEVPFFTIPGARSDLQGAFDLFGVAQGSYRIFVTRYGEGLAGLNGALQLEVADRDIDNLPIVIAPEFKVSGRLVMENGSRSYPRMVELARDPQTVGMMRVGYGFNSAADGSFTLEGVAPGDFRVTVRDLPAGGYVKAIRLGNADVLNNGLHLTGPPQGLLEITIGANAGSIQGTVLDSQQQALPGGTVALVPDIRLRQRADLYKVVTTDNAGRFQMTGLTPGEYKLFAWDAVETGAWQDPGFIAAYENAGRPAHIYEGGGENVQLQVIP